MPTSCSGISTQPVVPQLASQNGLSTVAHIELRQASNGAWYPLVAQEGKPSFTSYYQVDAKHYWELAASDTRQAFIISLPAETTAASVYHVSIKFDSPWIGAIPSQAPKSCCGARQIDTRQAT